jgi:hypothetical protein
MPFNFFLDFKLECPFHPFLIAELTTEPYELAKNGKKRNTFLLGVLFIIAMQHAL